MRSWRRCPVAGYVKRRWAAPLVSGPRVLLLDEPTNHLDIETIDWLEGFLKTFKGTIIFISHDRSFIRNMATRIVDLDRGKLVTYPGNYDQYLLDKEEALRVEELQNAEFDRKLAQKRCGSVRVSKRAGPVTKAESAR